MNLVDIHIRYAPQNVVLDKLAILTQEGNLVFNDDEGPLRTSIKFALLTASSPLFAAARFVRSAAFLAKGDPARAGSEFIGAITTPVLASGCFVLSLLASVVYLISSNRIRSRSIPIVFLNKCM